MNKILTLSYNASTTISLKDIAEEHEFELDNIVSLYVKNNDLNITLKDGSEIEHNIHHDLQMTEVDDFESPSFMSITKVNGNEHVTSAESEDNCIHLEDDKIY